MEPQRILWGRKLIANSPHQPVTNGCNCNTAPGGAPLPSYHQLPGTVSGNGAGLNPFSGSLPVGTPSPLPT